MSKQPDLAYGACREAARKPPVDMQELILKELKKLNKQLEQMGSRVRYEFQPIYGQCPKCGGNLTMGHKCPDFGGTEKCRWM